MLPRDDDRTESFILWQKQHLLELFKKRRITTNMQISAQGKKPAKSPRSHSSLWIANMQVIGKNPPKSRRISQNQLYIPQIPKESQKCSGHLYWGRGLQCWLAYLAGGAFQSQAKRPEDWKNAVFDRRTWGASGDVLLLSLTFIDRKMMRMTGWQDLAGFRRGQTWPWNLSSSA